MIVRLKDMGSFEIREIKCGCGQCAYVAVRVDRYDQAVFTAPQSAGPLELLRAAVDAMIAAGWWGRETDS